MSLALQAVSATPVFDQQWRCAPLAKPHARTTGFLDRRSVDKERLIADIYAAAIDGSIWEQVFARLHEALGGHTAIYERVHSLPQTHQLLATDLDPEFVRSYNEHCSGRNIWATSPLNHCASLTILERTIEPVELERTELYGEWLQPQGMKHAATATLLRQDRRSLNLGLVRGEERGPYSAEESRLMSELLPHFRRSVEIAARLEETTLGHQASLDTMTAEGTCLLVVNSSREIHFASLQAERLLRERAVITMRAGRLCGVGRTDAAKLEAAIFKATAAPAPAGTLLVLSAPLQTDRFSVAVTPVRGDRVGLFRQKRLCSVRVAKPDTAGAPSAEALATLFGLTPAEARLAHAISAGETLSDYADLNKVSITTVKSHLSALFGKTGVNRQIDLVRLIFADPIFSRSIN